LTRSALRNLKTTWPVRVIELDQEHDRLLASMDKVLAGMEGGPDDALSTLAAGKLRRTLFSAGLAALTQLDFVQQREQTQAWLTRLANESKEEIEVLGLKRMFDRLAVVTAEFGQLIDQSKQQAPMTYDKLRDAEAVGHDLILRFVVGICAKHNGQEPGDEAARASLLAPILEQNELVRDLYRKRAITDVDPETGDVVQPGVQPVGPVSPPPATGELPIGGGASPFTNK
jgi:hypothetical protein